MITHSEQPCSQQKYKKGRKKTQKLSETIYKITYEVQYSDGKEKNISDIMTKTVYDETVKTGLFIEGLSDKK